jgi:hypothetical protein
MDDARVEIRIAVRSRRQLHRAIFGEVQHGLNLAAIGRARRQQREQAMPQVPSRRRAQRQQRLQVGCASAIAISCGKRPLSANARKSRTASPIATPGLASPCRGANMPSGRFWMGKSARPFADAIQLVAVAAWVHPGRPASGRCQRFSRSTADY